ncbi:hypothetical protein V8F06_002292 [Rhypophila decipiens]
MNGMPPPFVPPAQVWQEHRTENGRSYYYNTVTRQTQWNKPEELLTPAERAVRASQPWKEYTADGGKPYWYNEQTKETTWEMPEAFRQAMATATTPTNPTASFEAPNGGHQHAGGGYGGFGGGGSRDHHREHRDMGSQSGFGANNVQAQAFVPANNDPEYATPEEAEAAFVKLLRQSKVQPEWTWEQALPTIMKDIQFRAIKDPKQRKLAFQKYCNDVVAQDKERAKERLSKLRADFATMLRSHPEIRHYTRWKTARPMIEGETIFRSTDNELERHQLFEDYIVELKRAHREQQVTMRKSAMDGLIELLPNLNLESYSHWSDGQTAIKNSNPFRQEEKYKAINKHDILTVFSNHIRALERARNESIQQEKKRKMRKERKARDAFIGLLLELKQDGKIKAGTKWSQVYPYFADDERYQALAGQPGSTAMDLFWDVLEDEERALRGTRNLIQDIIEDKQFKLTSETTLQEFEAFIKDDHRTASIEPDVLALIFERIREKKAKRPDEDRHLDRHQRRAIDDFRSFLKRLDPPITVNDTYEQVKDRIGLAEEFLGVSLEDNRQAAFEKHIRRLKEKEEELDRDRQRRRDRDDHRDRGERPHRNGGRSVRSRTPEQNPYEADRRKAIAERERNYRKSSMAESLLSDRKSIDGHFDTVRDKERDRDRHRDRERDTHRERDRDRDRDAHRSRDRDRERDRDRDGHRDRERDRDRDRDRERERDRDRDRDFDRRPRDEVNHYDRERRTREEDRERIYRHRVMDRDVDELPYGDEKPSIPVRRPRPAEEDEDRKEAGRPVTKRIKTDSTHTREQTPNRDVPQSKMTSQAPAAKEKQPAAAAEKVPAQSVRAGSEEGEIEED